MEDKEQNSNKSIYKQIIEVGKIVCDFRDICVDIISATVDSVKQLKQVLRTIVSQFNPENIGLLKQLDEEYTENLFQAQWFPYVGWNANLNIMMEVKAAIDSSKKGSERLKYKIDKIILAYYTDEEIKKISKNLNNTSISTVHKRIIKQAISAFFRKEYALTTVVLSSLWQTLIYLKSGDTSSGRKDKQSKKYFKTLVIQNDYSSRFNDYYGEVIMGDCYEEKDVNPDVPMRNANAHGWFIKYPTRKSAINAIIFTDFILKMKSVSG